MASCRIEMEEYEYAYTMTISKFKERLDWCTQNQSASVIKSPEFTTGIHETITWYVNITFYQTYSHTGDSIKFDLMNVRAQNPNILAKNTLYFRDVNGTEVLQLSQNSFIKIPAAASQTGNIIFSHLYQNKNMLDQAQLFLPNDELTLVFKIFVKTDYIMTPLIGVDMRGDQDPMSDFAKLHNDQEFSDIIIQVETKKYFAHKLILIARSEVFAAMFKHHLEEAESNVIKIVDLEADIFEKLLQYIYTNVVDNLDEIALDLLPAADKYELPGLRSLCAESLYKNLTIDNAAEIFILASRHNAEGLMEHTKHFINTYIRDVMKTAGYIAMEKEHPQSAIMIYRTLLAKMKNGPKA